MVAAGTERLHVPVEPACELALAHQFVEMDDDLAMGKLGRLVVLLEHVDRELVRKIIRRWG
jgi:hypothetical protein